MKGLLYFVLFGYTTMSEVCSNPLPELNISNVSFFSPFFPLSLCRFFLCD